MFWSDNKRVIIKSKRHRLKLSKKKKNPNTLETCLIILLKKKKKKKSNELPWKNSVLGLSLSIIRKRDKSESMMKYYDFI